MIFFSKQKKLVLLFHRVTPVRDKMWDPMDPGLFEETLQYVQNKFHVIPLNELLFDAPKTGSKPLASITFDDGYKDFITYSIPLLEKFSLPASMFVVTDCIEKNIPTWTYIVDHIFEHTKKLHLDNFSFSYLSAEFRQTKWHDATERISYGKRFKQHLKWISSDARNAIIECLLFNFNDVESPSGMMMSWDDIKQLNTAGFDVGSHSVTHPTLATVKNNAELNYELEYSAKKIKERTNIESSVFSYPGGSYDERVKVFTKEAGYKAGLAVNRQLYSPLKNDLFEIPRIELYNEVWYKTKLRINGTISFIEKIIRR